MKNILCRTTVLAAISLEALAASSNITRADPCAVDLTQNNCAPKCNIFYNVQPGRFPSNMIRSYAGRDLKDLTDGDLDHLRSDFIFCNATQSINMIHGVSNAEFPAFVEKTIADLTQQRNQQASGAPTNPTQAALLACPTALNGLKALQVKMDRLKSQNPNPNSQEGMKAICRAMEAQVQGIDQYISDLQTCKAQGIVGLQPVIQLSESLNAQSQDQYHQACD